MKQHQLIVTEPEKRGQYEKIRGETIHVFKGGDLFKGLRKSYEPKASDGDPLPGDEKQIVTTVAKRLAWTEKYVVEMMDYEATRDKTNMKAKADIVVNGVVLVKDLPATTLLSLEKRLKEVREYYDRIPTLDLSQVWDLIKGSEDTYQHGPEVQHRYVKQTSGVILAPATDKHQATVKEVTVDVHVGDFKSTHFSGEMQPGDKANFLSRIDGLITAVKEARQKANEAEVEELKVGQALFNYIHERKS